MTIERETVHEEDDLEDQAVGHAITVGTMIGILTIFVATFAVVLMAGASWGRAFFVAPWPAIVGGPFFGSLFAIGRVVRHEELRSKHHSPRPEAAPRSHARSLAA